MKRFLKFTTLTTLFLSFIFVTILSSCKVVASDISSSVLRLHILANSNSVADQSIKYKVRDNLIKYMTNNSNFKTKSEAISYLEAHKGELQKIAESTIRENGANYPVTIEIKKDNFPTKYYGNVKLPAGTYDAIKVNIGNANGHNWWCVMFPPLCFTSDSSGKLSDDSLNTLRSNLKTEDEYDIVSLDDAPVEFKFKLVEIYNKYFAQNASNQRF